MSLPESMSVPRTWNLVAPGYAVEIAPTFARFADDALELARLKAGERVLDVATGPGTLALAAAGVGAHVSAIDFSPRMIAELEARAARERLGAIDARVADATALPYDDESFDAVFSMFALNLMPNHPKALREIRRVMRKTGRTVVGTPASMKHLPAFEDVRNILRRTMPEIDFDGELPLSELDELEDAMEAAGFSDVTVRRVVRGTTYPSVGAIWEMAGRAAAPVVVAREAMGKDRWVRASERIVGELEERFGKGPQRLEITVNLARARK